jgi:hypothetical protein
MIAEGRHPDGDSIELTPSKALEFLGQEKISWRHHPADTLPRSLLLAVVRSQICSPPSTDRAPAAALDVLQNFFGLEAINKQRALMMAGQSPSRLPRQ